MRAVAVLAFALVCAWPRVTFALGVVPYLEARRAFEHAMTTSDAEDRRASFQRAGELYESEFSAHPDARDAPEGAINGAYAFRQIGAHARAIALLERFLASSADPAALAALERGTPSHPPDPRAYRERIRYVQIAYDTVATAYVVGFRFEAAADTYLHEARTRALAPSDRISAASSALRLFAAIGDEAKAREVFVIEKSLSKDKDALARDKAILDALTQKNAARAQPATTAPVHLTTTPARYRAPSPPLPPYASAEN
jgi:hypothetical protein